MEYFVFVRVEGNPRGWRYGEEINFDEKGRPPAENEKKVIEVGDIIMCQYKWVEELVSGGWAKLI